MGETVYPPPTARPCSGYSLIKVEMWRPQSPPRAHQQTLFFLLLSLSFPVPLAFPPFNTAAFRVRALDPSTFPLAWVFVFAFCDSQGS